MIDSIGMENRRAARIWEPGGRAMCTTGASTLHYQIQDTSSCGVALQGPELGLGTPVSLRLWWPMIGSASASGVVCRLDPNSHRLGVKYTDDGGLLDLLRDLSAIALMRNTEPTPLFCGASSGLVMAMEQLDDAGFDYEHAKTPLDAFRLLHDPWKPLTTIVCQQSPLWLEFAALIASEHPQLRRVLLADEEGGIAARRALEGAIVHNTLCEPCEPGELFGALRLPTSEDPCLSCGAQMAEDELPFCGSCCARSKHLCELDDLGEGD